MGFMFCQEDAQNLLCFTFPAVLGFALEVLVLVLLELFPLGVLLTELAIKALLAALPEQFARLASLLE
jgi:hypothetical protein